MRTKYFFFFLYLSIIFANAQTTVIKSKYEDQFSKKQQEIYKLWNNYINSWNVEDSNQCVFWEDTATYDILSTAFFNPSLYQLDFSNQVLSIKKLDKDLYLIQSQFYWVDEQCDLNPMAITEVLAQKQSAGNFLLKNYLSYSTKSWKIEKTKNIVYHFPENYPFDKEKAESADLFVENLQNKFDIEKGLINYYIFDNCADLRNNQGFYWVAGMGINDHCGFYDIKNNMIYTTVFYGENHYHELIHLLNTKYTNAHYILLSGLSIYQNYQNLLQHYSLQELFRNLKNYIGNNHISKINILNFPSFDPQINGEYLAGALLIDILLKKGGVDLLKEFLQNTATDEQLIELIHNKLQLSDDQLNKLIFNKISEMSDKDFKATLF